MTEPAEFEPTLDVPHAWIEEFTGEKYDANVPLALSYGRPTLARFKEIGVSIGDIQDDFAQGYSLQLRGGNGATYYILESSSFKVWARPEEGQSSGKPLLLITKIEPHPEQRDFKTGPLKGIVLHPIWEEVASAADTFLERLEARRILATPPPVERREESFQAAQTSDLWQFFVLNELLEVLRRHAKNTPAAIVEGEVLRSDAATAGDVDSDRVLRIRTNASLRGWREDMRVKVHYADGRTAATQIREVTDNEIEMDAPDGALPKIGEKARVEQDTHFALHKHQQALRQFGAKQGAGNWDHLRALVAAPNEFVLYARPAVATDREVLNDDLTQEQRRAVESAVLTPHAFFIQGPPGTGKTTVITEIVQRLVRRGERVLLLSSTHVAVDEVLRRVAKAPGVLPIRLTRDASRVEPSIRGFVYETARDELVKKVSRRREHAPRYWAQRNAKPDADLGRIEALQRVENQWIAGNNEPGVHDKLVEEIGTALLQSANFICATTVGVANRKFDHIGNVNTLIVDEASRVTDAEFLIGALRAERWILVGDERQLPPHVEPRTEYLLLAAVACSMVNENIAPDLANAVELLATEWEEEEQQHAFRAQAVLDVAQALQSNDAWGQHYRWPFTQALKAIPQDEPDPHQAIVRIIRHFFIESTFERAVRSCPTSLRIRLSEQRRMLDPIARIVREPVYVGEYRSPPPAILSQLGVRPLACDAFQKPVTFLNTEYRGREAKEELVGTGFVNALEALWIAEACDYFEQDLQSRRVDRKTTVSILCFYREQARRIRALLDKRERGYQFLQFRVIDAIDRIQGQESDIVLISFCRAKPPKASLNEKFGQWLRDLRRLNVAFTRARRALILVGHKPTLEKLGRYQPFYRHLFDLFEMHRSDMQMVHDFGSRRNSR